MYTHGAREEYVKALRMGQKEYKELTAAGQDPYPAVLDNILPDNNLYSIQDIPVHEIPAERITGVKSAGRTSAFTAGFLPLLDQDSEFAAKWINLCVNHLSDGGIRDPILCYEYLGDFYVQEGNKRASVLKYFGAAKIPCTVKRVMPRASEDPRIKAYYEFLEFFKDAGLYDIQFRKPGDYAKLLALLGKEPGEMWSEQERNTFSAYYHYFREAFYSLDNQKKEVRPEEALLLWLQVYSFKQLGELSAKELKRTLAGLWEDVVAGAGEEPVKVQTIPAEEGSKSLLSKLIPAGKEHLNVAFILQRDVDSSPWTRGHEQGREHLEQVMGDKVTARSYFHADSPEQIEAVLDRAVEDGAQLVFTTTPPMLRQTLKAAVKYPKVRFLNCSADIPLSSVRSYYGRIFEGKFITGAIAGAMAENDRVGYIGSYPILGVPAAINAFALGAQMTNPRVRIDLEWSCLPGDATQALFQKGIRLISNKDIPAKNQKYLEYGEFGTYLVNEDGGLIPLASPCWLWGSFYENVVRAIFSGSWDQKKGAPEAVNYWLGMDSGVVDVEVSEQVPESVRAMARLLARDMKAGTLDPFRRRLTAQDGTVKNDGSRSFEPKELLRMDWLCDNVEGRIPEFDELLPTSQTLVRELGLHRESIPQERSVDKVMPES